MSVLDLIVVVLAIVFLAVAYIYAVWESWDTDRREQRLEMREAIQDDDYGWADVPWDWDWSSADPYSRKVLL